MARLHKSLRVDEADAGRVRALMADGESEAAAYARVIRAGLDALEAAQDAGEGDNGAEGATGGADALRGALEAHVATLAAEVDTLCAQLEAKDEQISALTRITEQSQTLHAVAEHKALETSEAKAEKRGWLARILGR